MKNLINIAVCFTMMGCVSSEFPFQLKNGPKGEEATVADIKIAGNGSQLPYVGSEFQQLVTLPEFEAQIAKFWAIEERYKSVRAAQGFVVSASGDLGTQNNQGSSEVLSAGLVGQKSLNLQSENDLVLLNIRNEKKSVSLDIQYSIDKILSQQMILSLSKENLEEIRAIVAKYRRVYQENKSVLTSAITAGIVSSTEDFKLRKILSGHDRRLHEAEASYASLELQSKRYSDVLSEGIGAVANESAENLLDRAISEERFVELQKLNLQLAVLNNEKSLIEAQKKLQGTFVSRLASPTTEDDGLNAFVGLNFTLPIFDGGGKNFQLLEKQRLSDGVNASIRAYVEKNNDAKKQLQKMNDDIKISIAMLLEEQALSNEIITDLETRLSFGGASISDLVSELLSLADLELQLSDKRRQMKQHIIEYTSVYGISCSLTNSCNELGWSTVLNDS
ncbi:hypothetical protein N9F04_03725 [Ascidiaceihabitans sp.]|nr:hypothetical protein [Ascidiaceihabitans sp.]